ncbi:MAG: 6-phospho-beta-glucosidase [Propionibacteriaceae bacterium]|jgi:6-phospho-beta-glucosidase|nr:6-phospho-beta-glucosidase [Propionibacteriaceae bacterium]
MKLTVIGGGSTYTPELIDGFARLRELFPMDELCLVDPDARRLGLTGGVTRRMFAHDDYDVKVTTTDDPVRGVADAGVVLFQLRVGGQAARKTDELFPHCCGLIGQETTGPGGFAKALRTVPVVLELADIVKKHAAPNTWIIDFTNPVGIVTRALLQAGHRAIGLCNVAIGFRRRFAKLLGVGWEHVDLDHVGLNHLSWERGVYVDGVDRLPEMLSEHIDEIAEEVDMPRSLIELLGVIPSYYLHYFYQHDEVLAGQLAPGAVTRAEAVMAVEEALLAKYADPSVDTKPPELEKRGGAFYSDAAVDLLASLTSDRQDTQVVNVRNDGVLPFLPDDHVIEIPARIGSDGVSTQHSRARAPMSDDQAGLVAHVAAYERLALDAAVHGGRDRVVKALLAHPLVGQYAKAEKLADELIARNRSFLAWAG